MKVLILSSDTGEGHNSAAKAVQEAFASRGVGCDVVDTVSFGGKRPQRIVSGSYNGIVRKMPAAFGAIYKVGDMYSSTRIPSPVYFANTLYAKNLHAYIKDNAYDTVLCTHLFAMESLTHIRKKDGISIPCFGILTDYTCIPFFAETKLDEYYVPTEPVRRECISKGMDGERIIPYGIPVSPRFQNKMDRDAARDYLAIPKDADVFLIMTGGVGSGNAAAICDRLLKHRKNEFLAYVFVGRNEEMKETVEKLYHDDPKIRAVAFTEDINIYMNAADVLISKAGGITSTEAAVSGIPLVHTMMIPGCETKNAEYFEETGMSVRANSPEAAAVLADELVQNREKAERMREIQLRTINANAANDIAERIMTYEK